MFSKTLLSFIKNDKPFYPIISDTQESNTTIINLDCSMGSNLDWKVEETDKVILWNLDFDFQNLKFPLEHKLQFESLKLAVETFTKTIYPKYKEQTLGVSFYQGSVDVFSQFENNPDIFVDYLRLFFSSLEDQVMPFLVFDAEELSDPVKFCRTFRKERFEYFSLVFKNHPLKTLFTFTDQHQVSSIGYIGSNISKTYSTPALGLVFPPENKIDDTVVHSLQQAFDYLSDKPFRLVYETHLIEEIDCLDTLITLENGLSVMGKRQIQGFLAAGGQVIDSKELKVFSG